MTHGVSSSRRSELIDQKIPLTAGRRVHRPPRVRQTFVVGGLAYNRITGARYDLLFGSRTDLLPPPSIGLTRLTGEFEPTSRQSFGLVFGAGLEWRLGRFKIAPEARLWNWFSRNFDNDTARSKTQQLDFLLGLLL